MATNVTERDKTLNEIIDWCKRLENKYLRLSNVLLSRHEMDAYDVAMGQANAYGRTAYHCRSLLGYSGNMPTEVPNQSEDAEEQSCGSNADTRTNPSHHRLKGTTMTRYLVTDQQLRYAIHSAIRALDISKQDNNHTIESTAKVSDKALELLASSKLAENAKQHSSRETDMSEHPFIRLEPNELVKMICSAYQKGKEY